MPRPRVLIATHLFPTPSGPLKGPWVAEQADALAAHADITVFAASQHAADGSLTRPSGVEVVYRDISTPLGAGRVGLLASTALYRYRLSQHLSRNPNRYDVVHAHFGFPDAVVASQAVRSRRVPLVVTLHGDDAFRVLPRRDPVGAGVRSALRKAEVTICVSAHMERHVRAIVPDARTVTIGNGFDDDLFGLSTGPRSGLLFVGLLVPVKNVDVLLRAFARVANDLIDDDLTIVGEGPLEGSLVQLAGSLGIDDRVHFRGLASREEVADLMGRSRAVVLPSSSEGWPLVVCESLATGTPVIASRVGGIPEIMASEDAGVMVEPHDPEALASAILRVVSESRDPHVVASASGARSIREQAGELARIYQTAAAGCGDQIT